MRIKERWRVDQFIRSAKRGRTIPDRVIRLRVSGGGNRWQNAAVWAQDGKAIVVPTFVGNLGILVVDWYEFMRYARRHNL